MRKSNVIVFLVINIVLFMLLQILRYEDQQFCIRQEQAQLYSSHNIKTMSTLKTLKDNLKGGYRVFCEIEAGKEIVRTFYSNDYREWNPPLQSGSFFKETDTKEAIVGERVLKESKDQRQYLYNGEKYRIIGVFTNNSSYLENLVILNNSSLFGNGLRELVIDSNQIIHSDFKLEGERFLPISISQEDSDVKLGRVIKKFGLCLESIFIFFIAYYFFTCSKSENHIKFLIGTSIRKLIFRQLLKLFIYYSIGFFLLYLSISDSMTLKKSFLMWSVIYMLEMDVAFVVLNRWRRFYEPV